MRQVTEIVFRLQSSSSREASSETITPRRRAVSRIRQNWGEQGVDSVRTRVRFIELEQQAAIRHNSIISFFRAFLPSSPRYDSSRCSRTYTPIRSSRRLHPRSSLSSSLLVSFVLTENREFQIPNLKHLSTRNVLYASGIFFGRDLCVCICICKIVIEDTIRVCPSLYAHIHTDICMISVNARSTQAYHIR